MGWCVGLRYGARGDRLSWREKAGLVVRWNLSGGSLVVEMVVWILVERAHGLF